VSNRIKIIIGDRVRVLDGSHSGEIATVGKVIEMTNQFGPYVRLHLTYAGGKVASRSLESVERVSDAAELLPHSQQQNDATVPVSTENSTL
jgi:ribosomal protein L24